MPSGQKINLSDHDISKIIEDYTEYNLSARDIAKKMGLKCHKSIIKILTDNGIVARTHKQSLKLYEKIFTSAELFFIKSQYLKPEVGITEIARELNCDPKTIKKSLQNMGVKYNQYKFDNYLIDKFEIIDSEEKAYWLGFLLADGSVSNKQLILQLAEKDKNHLLRFKKFINVDYDIRKIISKNKKHTAYAYGISSTKFCSSLKKHNLIPNKSFSISIPSTVPTNLIHHFIRGLFDGDGSIGYYNKRLSFSLVSSLVMCDMVQEHLITNCDLRKTKQTIRITKNLDKYSYIKYCGNLQVKRIYDYLYRDATIFLERKKYIFELHK